MTQETKTKKNTDYSASAVNLTNHECFKGMFLALRDWQEKKAQLEAELKVRNAEIYQLLEGCDKEIFTITNDIKLSIDQYGSYQDLENGIYAVKQRKVSLSYDPKVLRIKHPKEAELVITEIVDSKKLDGLVKGGLLDKGALITEGIAKETESYAYIIK